MMPLSVLSRPFLCHNQLRRGRRKLDLETTLSTDVIHDISLRLTPMHDVELYSTFKAGKSCFEATYLD